MANARQTHGKRTAEQTHGTGPPKGIPENLQGISGTHNGATWDSKGRRREASGKLWRMLVLCSRSEARMPVHAQRCHSNALPVHTLRQVFLYVVHLTERFTFISTCQTPSFGGAEGAFLVVHLAKRFACFM